MAPEEDDMNDLAERLAARFAADLKASLTVAQWRQMRAKNVEYGEGVCASHDYCDANMIMEPAFVAIVGRDPLDEASGMSEADCELWSKAWDIAKALYLTEGSPL